MDPKLIDLVEKIADALVSQSPNQGEQLGFIESAGKKYVSVANENNGEYLFHTWDKINERQVPIYKTRFAGYLTGIDIYEDSFKGKPTFKLNLNFNCGKETIVLSSGLDTVFSRGAVLAIAQIPLQRLKERIVISVKPGDEKTVLCSVYSGADFIKAEWHREPLEPLIAQINRNLAYAPREAGQTEEPQQQKEAVDWSKIRRPETASQPVPGQREYIEAPTERASPFTGLKPVGKSLASYVQDSPPLEKKLFRTSSDNDITSIIAQINIQMKEKGITPPEARQLTIERYGKNTRTVMSLEELQDFLRFLQEEYPF